MGCFFFFVSFFFFLFSLLYSCLLSMQLFVASSVTVTVNVFDKLVGIVV